MKTFDQLVTETTALISEIMPWDLSEQIQTKQNLLIIDVREADEFDAMHIQHSINIPRGILEAACEYGYDESVPVLANARKQDVVVICRSGRRSCLAAYTLQLLGFQQVTSLKTGLRGWNDFDQPLVDNNNKIVDGNNAEEFLRPKVQSV